MSYYRMGFGERMSDDFIKKISFHMLQITVSPHRSIEFTEKLMEDERSCEHTKRVCRQLIDRLNKFKPADEDPAVKNLQFAARYMKGTNFQDDYVRIAGMFLAQTIKHIFEPVETSPDCT